MSLPAYNQDSYYKSSNFRWLRNARKILYRFLLFAKWYIFHQMDRAIPNQHKTPIPRGGQWSWKPGEREQKWEQWHREGFQWGRFRRRPGQETPAKNIDLAPSDFVALVFYRPGNPFEEGYKVNCKPNFGISNDRFYYWNSANQRGRTPNRRTPHHGHVNEGRDNLFSWFSTKSWVPATQVKYFLQELDIRMFFTIDNQLGFWWHLIVF